MGWVPFEKLLCALGCKIFWAKKKVEWPSHHRITARNPLHDAASELPVLFKATKKIVVILPQLRQAALQTSDGVHQISCIEKVDGDESLQPVLLLDVPIVNHVDCIIRDGAVNVLIRLKVEDDEVELGDLSQILIPGCPQRCQIGQWGQLISRVRCLDEVTKTVQFTIDGVESQSRQCGADGLIRTVALKPNRDALGQWDQGIEEASVMRLLPVGCHGDRTQSK